MDVPNCKDWNKLRKRMIGRYSQPVENDTIFSSIFIEYIIGTLSTDPVIQRQNRRFVSSFNNLVKRVLKDSDKSLHHKIKSKIKNIFITGDNDVQGGNSDFKNGINELLAIDYFNQCGDVRITEIEKPLYNGKSIDLVIKHNSGDTIGVEMFTMQNIGTQRQKDNKSMSDFLFERINKKYYDKVTGLSQINELDNLLIMPIVEFSDGLENLKFGYPSQISTPIMCSHLNRDKDGEWEVVLSEINMYLETRRAGNVNE